MRLKFIFLCFLLFVKNVYADNVDLDSMSVIDLYNHAETINYDYEELEKAKQQQKTLAAVSIVAMGIGGMELAQGLAEQKADKAAERDMDAYMATFRCEYGRGNSVKFGPDEIELPAGNDSELMKLRNEYFSLVNRLKKTKTALKLASGIESESILDKAETGLYENQNAGTTSGVYGSLYRAKNGSEADQENISTEKEKSSKRVKGGGIAAGVGTMGSVVGNQLINSKIGTKNK